MGVNDINAKLKVVKQVYKENQNLHQLNDDNYNRKTLCKLVHQVLVATKRVAVMTITISVTGPNKETLQEVKDLNQVAYVYYAILL